MRRLGAALIAIAALTLLAPASAPAAGRPASADARLLIGFSSGSTRHERAALARSLRVRVDHEIGAIATDAVRVPRTRAAATLRRLRRNPLVDFAERDRVLEPQELLPADPSFPSQFALAGGAWGWTMTRTTQAWDVTTGDPSVVIAVLDTGLRAGGLDDFDGQLVPGWNVVNGSSDTASSAGAHGTYVAGVAGLALGNGTGNAGYCPGCRIMPVQVGSDSGASLSNLASGLVWAAEHGARVANMSWAGTSSSSTLQSAVDYARGKGVVVTAAAGNSNCDCRTYPAATAGVLGVAGVGNSGAKQGDSNFGSWVAIAAPEGNMTAWPTINGAPGYAPVGGTSLAAPVVAAIAGLVFSAVPSASGAQVEQALKASAVPVGFSVASGRVDALGALGAFGLADPQPSTAPLNGAPPRILLATNGDYDSAPLAAAPQPGQVLIRGQGSWTGSAPLALAAVKWLRCDTQGASCATVATTTRYTVQTADTGSTLRLSIAVRNGLGTTTALSQATAVVGGTTTLEPPASSSPPVISGNSQAGSTLSTTPGGWTGSPASYAYRWRRCGASGCADIAGASAASYTLESADVGASIVAVVTASNVAGTASAASAATATVAAAPVAAPAPVTTTFSGSLTAKTSVRSFSVTAGAGGADARLSFSRCASLSVALRAADGTIVGSASGPSVLSLSRAVAAGNYVYEVSGGRCSFTLAVTAAAP
jgi:hypothetical protein